MPMSPKAFRLTPKTVRQEKSQATIERCKKYRTKGWATIREQIIVRDGMECQMCHHLCIGIGKGEAHVDHIIAVVDGGTDEADNLRTLCQSCHSTRTMSDQNGRR